MIPNASRRQGPRTKVRPPRPLTLFRHGQYLELVPAVQGLERYLYTLQHVPVDDPQHGQRVEARPLPLVWHQQDLAGRTYTQGYAGLEPILQELLKGDAYAITLAGNRPGLLPAPARERLAAFAVVDDPVLELVRQHDRGLLHYDPAAVAPGCLIA